jgi:hypothetical protein
MVPTVVPDNVDYMAIAMEEKARIRDKMPSAILNATFGSGPNGDGAQKMPNNAEVRFFISPAVNKTRSHIPSHLRLYNLGVAIRIRT